MDIILLIIVLAWLVMTIIAKINADNKITELKNSYIQLQNTYNDLVNRYDTDLLAARKEAITKSKAVIRGQVAEQLSPFMPEFPYKYNDVKFLGQPIDIICFKGMSDYRDGDESVEIEIVFMDIKTEGATLTKVQRAIRDAIKAKRVKFETFKP